MKIGDKVKAAARITWDDGPPHGVHVVEADEVGVVVHDADEHHTVDFGNGPRGDERVTLVLVGEVVSA